MKHTLREYLADRLSEVYRDEELVWAIQEYFSHNGMEWTPDDEAVIREYGEDPSLYLTFDEDQLNRIDDVYEAVHQLCHMLMQRPPYWGDDVEQRVTFEMVSELADKIAERLTVRGYDVWFPTHVEDDDREYITDVYPNT